MPTVDDVARSVLALTDTKSQVGPELSATWVFECYKELVGKVQFKHLRVRFTITAPAPLTVGTATFTQGSTSVTSSGAGFDMQHIGWFIRPANVWCRIAAVNPATQVLTLESPFTEASMVSTSFNAVQRYLALPENIRWIGQITHPRRRRQLKRKTMVYLDAKHPSRLLIGPHPYAWAEAVTSHGETGVYIPKTGDPPQSTDRRKWVEVYPPSNVQEQYDGIGWQLPEKFEPEDPLPPEIDEYILRNGVMEFYYRSKGMEMIEKSPEAAQILFNMADRQHTKWIDSIQNAIISDRLNDDVEVSVGVRDDEIDEEDDLILARDQVFPGDVNFG